MPATAVTPLRRIKPGNRRFDTTGIPVNGSNADPYATVEAPAGFVPMGDRIDLTALGTLLDSYGLTHGDIVRLGRHANTHFTDHEHVFIKVVEPTLLGSHRRCPAVEVMPEFQNRHLTDPLAAAHAYRMGLPVARPLKDTPVVMYPSVHTQARLTLWEFLPDTRPVGWWNRPLLAAVAGFAGRMATTTPHPGARPADKSYRHEIGRHRLETPAPAAAKALNADTPAGERARLLLDLVRTELLHAYGAVQCTWEKVPGTWGTSDLHLGNVLASPSAPDGFIVLDFEYAALLPLEAELAWAWAGVAGNPVSRERHTRHLHALTARTVREFLGREPRLDVAAAAAWLRSANRAALAIQHGDWEVVEPVLAGCRVLSDWVRQNNPHTVAA